MKLLQFWAVIFLVASVVSCQTVLTGDLTGDAVVPPVVTDATGYVDYCILDEIALTVSCSFTHTVIDATSAGLYAAPEGVNGQLLYSFTNFRSVTAINFQTFNLTAKLGKTVAQQITSFKTNGIYLSITSVQFPFGEVRAQLVVLPPIGIPSKSFSGNLLSSNVMPGPVILFQNVSYVNVTKVGNVTIMKNATRLVNYTAIGNFSCLLSQLTTNLASLSCITYHNLSTVLNGGLYYGSDNSSGTIFYSFGSVQANSTNTNVIILQTRYADGVPYFPKDQIEELINGNFFIQFSNLQDPNGVLRGQLMSVDTVAKPIIVTPPAGVGPTFQVQVADSLQSFAPVVPVETDKPSKVYYAQQPVREYTDLLPLVPYKPGNYVNSPFTGEEINSPNSPALILPGYIPDLVGELSPIASQAPRGSITPIYILVPKVVYPPIAPVYVPNDPLSPLTPIVEGIPF